MVKTRNLIVRCPKCGWRIMDKVTPTTGTIEIKCSRCNKIVKVDLSLRRNIKYRRITARQGHRN